MISPGGLVATLFKAKSAVTVWLATFNKAVSTYIRSAGGAPAQAAYTIEFWYMPATVAANDIVFDTVAYYSPRLIWSTNTVLTFYVIYIGAPIVNMSTSPATGVWSHIAIVKSSNNANGVTVYLNGQSVGTGTVPGNAATSDAFIGVSYGLGSGASGKISNFRIVDGTAVYTGNFAVPVPPLTAISGTTLLALTTSSITKDSSANNRTLTTSATPPVGSSTVFG